MKVLVTGAAGFIGSHTSEALVRRDHDVIGYDSFDTYLYDADRKRRNVEEVRAAVGSLPFELVDAGIEDRAAIRQALEGVDVVCHLAALAGVRPSLQDPARYMRTNVEGSTVLYEACRDAGIDRIVFASSSSVYGDRSGDSAFHEDDDCLVCASPYAASKRSAELVSRTFSDLYGLGMTGLRYFTVYGPRQRPDMAIHKFVRAACQGEPVPFYGDGSSSRDYTFIDDIVAGTVGAVEAASAGQFGIYNLGGTATTSLKELISIIEEVTGRTVPLDCRPLQPGDVLRTYADTSRAEQAFGYRPTTDVRSGLARFWEWYQRAELG